MAIIACFHRRHHYQLHHKSARATATQRQSSFVACANVCVSIAWVCVFCVCGWVLGVCMCGCAWVRVCRGGGGCGSSLTYHAALLALSCMHTRLLVSLLRKSCGILFVLGRSTNNANVVHSLLVLTHRWVSCTMFPLTIHHKLELMRSGWNRCYD